ncbi:energy transducer TonB [soil metagenome]
MLFIDFKIPNTKITIAVHSMSVLLPKFNWSNPASEGRIEIVFAERNKELGAYVIRKAYEKNLLTAFIIAITVLLFAFAIPYLGSLLEQKSNSKDLLSEEITLAEPPSIDKLSPPPPPVIIPPPVQQTIKFTPPKIVKDELVQDPPPTQEEMKDVQVSTVTQEGTNEEILPPENPVTAQDEDKVFSFVEEMPSFPGGEKKMIEFILSNIHYPPVALENNIAGKVYVKFTVDKEGKITNPELLRGIGGGCDEEAMRILRMMPDWSPGKQNGNKVKVGGIVLHIDFTLR